MTTFPTDENRRRTRQAADYLIEQHGEGAIAEAEAAHRYACVQNDRSTIDALTDILGYLKDARLT